MQVVGTGLDDMSEDEFRGVRATLDRGCRAPGKPTAEQWRSSLRGCTMRPRRRSEALAAKVIDCEGPNSATEFADCIIRACRPMAPAVINTLREAGIDRAVARHHGEAVQKT